MLTLVFPKHINKSQSHFQTSILSKNPPLVMNVEKSIMKVDENIMKMPILNPMAFHPRFPHIAEQIFEKITKESLKICRLLSKSWLQYIDNQNFLWKKIVEDEKEIPNKAFRKAISMTPISTFSAIGHPKMAEFLIKNSIKYNIDLNARVNG